MLFCCIILEKGGGSGVVTFDFLYQCLGNLQIMESLHRNFIFALIMDNSYPVLEKASLSPQHQIPSLTETFSNVRSSNSEFILNYLVVTYLQVTSGNELRADYLGIPGWEFFSGFLRLDARDGGLYCWYL
ncbi:hypothetical protein MKX03_001864 [Papaver bracteatum]|nr:hypothetical protein MKX03_001864 [Papaver bracteatum]